MRSNDQDHANCTIHRRDGLLGLRALQRALVFVVIALLVACSVESNHTFRVGTNIWRGYETLYLARALGLYRDSDIKLVELPNASEVIQALCNGALEAAALTLDETMSVVQDGYDLRVVLVMDFSRGGDALLGGPEFDTLADIRGHRVGVENTAVGALLLNAALRSAGLSVDDVELVLLTVDDHQSAFASGSVDAIVPFEPVRTQLVADGATPLYDSGRIPNRIVDVLVVPADIARDNDKALRTLLSGHFAALAHMLTHPGESADIIAARAGLPANEVGMLYRGIYQPGWRENGTLLAPRNPGLGATVDILSALMQRRGMLHAVPDTSRLLTTHWLLDRG